MVRCMIRSHNQQYKIAARGDDAENMCSSTLEPDPRYQGCCSNIFRPGKVLRDVIIGFLVVLAIAVVIAVLFVVCFYVLPETESADKLEESAFVGKPIEDEVNINEVELTDNTRYDVRPDVVLESIRKDKELNDPNHDAAEHHEEHHRKESTATVESEPEEAAAPEPEPEGDDHEHIHEDDGMAHEHSSAEGKMHDGHLANFSEISHESKTPHDHEVSVSEMPHEMDKGDALPHDHMHTDSHDHMHTGPHDDMHTGPHDHTHTGPHDHMHTGSHDNMHTGGHLHHEDGNKAVEMPGEHTESEHTHDHTMGHEHEGTAFAPSAPVNEEVLEVVGAPALETTPELPTERTVVSVSSPSGPGAKVQVQSSESEFTATSDPPVSFEERFASGILPPLFETLGPRFNGTGSFSGTEEPTGTQPEKEPEEVIVPGFGIEEVESPFLRPEEVLPAQPVATGPGTCRKRQVEMCSDLPYGLTSLPNWANDQTERDLNESSLPFFRDVIVRSGCSPRARQYACGILEPPCKSDGSIVPPCRTFCRSVAATCQEFVISAVSLRGVFDCEKFPDSTDPAVCFDMTQGFAPVIPSSNVASAAATATATAAAAAVEEPETQTGFPADVDEASVTTTLVPEEEEALEETTTDSTFPSFFSGEATTFVPPSECPELQCLDGTCLALNQLNDGVNDCPDGTDEQDFGSLF